MDPIPLQSLLTKGKCNPNPNPKTQRHKLLNLVHGRARNLRFPSFDLRSGFGLQVQGLGLDVWSVFQVQNLNFLGLPSGSALKLGFSLVGSWVATSKIVSQGAGVTFSPDIAPSKRHV